MPVNPYNPSGSQWSDNHLIQGRVSQEDFFWFKGHFPYGCTGLIDKTVTTLYKKLIDELRQIDREVSLDPAWSVDHESYRILDDAIDRLTFLERRAIGVDSSGGTTPTQHESGGIDRVRAAVQPVEVVSPVTEGKSKTRKRSVKGTKKEKVKRRNGT